MRVDGRQAHELRQITIEAGINMHAEGSVIITAGNTKVYCTASVEERVPPFLKGRGSGWLTAEYDMLPRATQTRNQRDRGRSGINGRSQEIQRLIGRSLRTVCQLELLGERTLQLDCDVLQADGGTRTAAISGLWLALALALDRLVKEKQIRQSPLIAQAAAISVGLVGGRPLLDLCYIEDSAAQVDMNVVMTGQGELIEVQGCGEKSTFTRTQMNQMLDLAETGLQQIFALQRTVLREHGVAWPEP